MEQMQQVSQKPDPKQIEKGMLAYRVYPSFVPHGKMKGQVCMIVETTGCNLRCRNCPVPELSYQDARNGMTLDDVLAALKEREDIGLILLTGGEITLRWQVSDLIEKIGLSRRIILETNGLVRLEKTRVMAYIDHVVVSPKLSTQTPLLERMKEIHLHKDNRMNHYEIWNNYSKSLEVRFIISSPIDLELVMKNVLANGWMTWNVWLMPAGDADAVLTEEIRKYCLGNGFNFTE